jgi:hypothetical protein
MQHVQVDKLRGDCQQQPVCSFLLHVLESFVSNRFILFSYCNSYFIITGVYFILTTEKNNVSSHATIVMDNTLLHPKYQHLLSYQLRNVLSDEEFEEEEKYIYGTSDFKEYK